MTVLVLTSQFDPTADLVVQELTMRGVCVFRCDAGEFPERLALSADLGTGWVGRLRTADREVALESISAAYYRRPSRFVLADGMSATERRFAAAEAEYKPLQLSLAAQCAFGFPGR